MHRTILPEAPEGQDAGAVVDVAGMEPIPDSRSRAQSRRVIMVEDRPTTPVRAAVTVATLVGLVRRDLRDLPARNLLIRRFIRRPWTIAIARCRTAATMAASDRDSDRSSMLRTLRSRCQ